MATTKYNKNMHTQKQTIFNALFHFFFFNREHEAATDKAA